MKRHVVLGCLFVLAACLLGGCFSAHSISESRMIYVPPKPADCQLEFLQVPMEEMTPLGRFHILGHVSIADFGELDPFSPENKRVVQERACRMGGEAVTVVMAASTATYGGLGSRILYGVLKKKASGIGDAPAPNRRAVKSH